MKKRGFAANLTCTGPGKRVSEMSTDPHPQRTIFGFVQFYIHVYKIIIKQNGKYGKDTTAAKNENNYFIK